LVTSNPYDPDLVVEIWDSHRHLATVLDRDGKRLMQVYTTSLDHWVELTDFIAALEQASYELDKTKHEN
jgi:hypothetical protein